MRIVHDLNSWHRRISCVTHPHATGIVESDRFGGIRVEVGPAGYVLQSGERVTLGDPLSDRDAMKAFIRGVKLAG